MKMKRFNRFGFVMLIMVLMAIVSGCGGPAQKNPTDTEVISAPSTSATTKKTDNNTSTTVDIDKILEEQRLQLENEQALREDTTIAAKVADAVIYQWQIDIKYNQNNAILESYRMNLDTMDLSEEERAQLWEIYISMYPLSKKDILNELIRELVIQIEAGKRGLVPADEDVIEDAQKQFDSIKKTAELYRSARLHMEVMNLSEEAYFRLIIDEHKKVAGQAKLYEQITERFDTKAEKDNAFNDTVDEWVAQSDVVFINNYE